MSKGVERSFLMHLENRLFLTLQNREPILKLVKQKPSLQELTKALLESLSAARRNAARIASCANEVLRRCLINRAEKRLANIFCGLPVGVIEV